MSGLSLRHITKSYGENSTVISDFSLEIGEKEFLLLVGPSGCGKSTLLRMISGTENITQGELYIGGVLSNEIPPSERQIALVSKCYALFPNFNVFENMAYGLKLRNTSNEEIKRRVEEAANTLEITHLLERRPKTLSAGQQLRVALGRALTRKPKVLLLNEPFSELDLKLRSQMLSLLASLHDALGITFIYATGDQAEALSIGRRAVLIKEGVIQQIDTPQNLYEKPANLFAAGFMGTPEMNFIEAKLIEEDRQVKACFGKVPVKTDLSVKISLPTLKQLAAAPYAGKEVIAGIRPGQASLGQGENSLEMIVEAVEALGGEVTLTLLFEGQPFTVLTSGRAGCKAGDKVSVVIPSERLFLFDKKSGKAIA